MVTFARRCIDPVAEAARRVVSATFGVDVECWDDGARQGAYDLRCVHEGRSYAIEAKRVVDETFRAAEKASKDAGHIYDERLKHCWIVRLKHSASWKRARLELPTLLLLAEQEYLAGVHDLHDLHTVGPFTRGTATLLEGLGVTSARPVPSTTEHPSWFYMFPEGFGGVVPSIEELPDYLSKLLGDERMETLRRQLAAADTDERHAFLVIGWEDMTGVSLDTEGVGLPTTDPELPAPLTGVWCTSVMTTPRVMYWVRGKGWGEGVAPPEVE